MYQKKIAGASFPFVFFALVLIVVIGNNPTSAINEWCKRKEDCTRVVGNVMCFFDKCRCQENNINIEFFGREECLPVALNGPGSQCKHDRQCSEIMNNLSRCNKGYPGQQGTCECYDVHEDGRKQAVYANGQCIYRKSVGDRCLYNEECAASIGRRSTCKDNKCTKDKSSSSAATGILPSVITVGLTLLGFIHI